VKCTQPKAKDKERRETNTPKNIYPVRSKLSYYPTHYQRVLYKEI